MKTSQKAACPAASVLAATLISSTAVSLAQDATDPIIPVGRLSAFPVLVQTGTHPNLTWDIQYPETIKNLAVVDPGGRITPTKNELFVDIRVIGGSHQIGTQTDGTPTYGHIQAEVAIQDVASSTLFFYETEDHVSPTHVYATASVDDGEKISFKARAWDGNSWVDYAESGSDSKNVAAFVNGSSLPKTIGSFSQGKYESFLDPYLDAGGKVRIGPKDILILFELDQTEPSAPGFDLQDFGILVTMDYIRNNNGHGNNTDGVDASNPGGAPFIDSDPTVDDEGTGGGAYPSINP